MTKNSIRVLFNVIIKIDENIIQNLIYKMINSSKYMLKIC